MRNTSLRTQKYIFFPDKKDVRHLHPGCAPSSPDTEPILSGHSGNAEKKDSKALKQANLHPIGYKTNDYAPIYTRMGIKKHRGVL